MKNFLSFCFACLIAVSGLIAAPIVQDDECTNVTNVIENACAVGLSDVLPGNPIAIIATPSLSPRPSLPDVNGCISVAFVNGQWQANQADVNAAIMDEWALTSGQAEAAHCCIVIVVDIDGSIIQRVTVSHPDYGQFDRNPCN